MPVINMFTYGVSAEFANIKKKNSDKGMKKSEERVRDEEKDREK